MPTTILFYVLPFLSALKKRTVATFYSNAATVEFFRHWDWFLRAWCYEKNVPHGTTTLLIISMLLSNRGIWRGLKRRKILDSWRGQACFSCRIVYNAFHIRRAVFRSISLLHGTWNIRFYRITAQTTLRILRRIDSASRQLSNAY